MKKYRLAVFYIGLLIAFLGCRQPTGGTNDVPLGPPKNDKIYVQFKNQNDFAVTIYSDASMNVPFAEIGANASSDPIEVSSGISEVQYYPQYQIIVEDITVLFDGDSFFSGIEKNKRNEVEVPSLTELDLSKPITDKVYIKIENKSSLSLLLRKGPGEINPDGASSLFLNAYKTGLYIVDGGSVSYPDGYSFRKNGAEPIEFPSGITKFIAGHLYSFRYENSALLLITDKILTIAEAITLLPPENITARALSSTSIKITWDRAGTEASYKIYRTTGLPQAESNYTPVGTSDTTSYTDTGLTSGTTYYYRLISVKNNLESELSSAWASAKPSTGQLSPPEGLSAVLQSAGSIKLSWSPVSDALGYLIYRGGSSARVNVYVDITDLTEYTIIGLSPNTGYYFQVSAFDLTTETKPSAAVPARTAVGNGSANGSGHFLAPSGVSAEAESANAIAVHWNPVSGASFYEVYCAENSSGPYNDISGVIAETAYTDTGLEGGRDYYYKIRSYTADGTKSSNLSEHASARAQAVPIPAAPGLPIAIAGSSQITVSWSAVEDAESYEVWAGTSSNSVEAEKRGGDVPGLSVTIDGLANGTTYYVWIKAKNSIGTSGFSPSESATPLEATTAPQAPGKPLLAAGDTQITVSWPAAEGAESYEVWEGISNDSAQATKRGGDVSGLSTILSGLTNGTTYHVWIKAKNSVGTSGFSEGVSGTTLTSTSVVINISAIEDWNDLLVPEYTAVKGSSQVFTVSGSYDAYQWYLNGRVQSGITASYTLNTASMNEGVYEVMVVVSQAGESRSGRSRFIVQPRETIPAPPVNVLATALSSGSISISWTPAAGMTYGIYRSGSLNGIYIPVQTGVASSPYSDNTGLAPYTRYYYKVAAVNSAGTEGISGTSDATTYPAVMGNVSAKAESSNSIRISWIEVNGAVQYKIARSESAVGVYNPVGTTNTGFYTDTGLSPNTSYYYKVSSVDNQGREGQQSGYISAATNATVSIGIDAMQIVSLSPATAIVTATQAFSVTGSFISTEVSYQWYWDGERISGAAASTYTVNVSSVDTGIHQLTVVVINTQGEQRSGRSRVIIRK